eukprot:1281826-Alexandrium_andersonii.AAC.1
MRATKTGASNAPMLRTESVGRIVPPIPLDACGHGSKAATSTHQNVWTSRAESVGRIVPPIRFDACVDV